MRILSPVLVVFCLVLPQFALAATPLKAGHWKGPRDGNSRYHFCVEIKAGKQIILTFSPRQQGLRRPGDIRLVARGSYDLVRRRGTMVELRVNVTRMDRKGYGRCRKTVNYKTSNATVLGRLLEIRGNNRLLLRLYFKRPGQLKRACVLGIRNKKKRWFCQAMKPYY